MSEPHISYSENYQALVLEWFGINAKKITIHEACQWQKSWKDKDDKLQFEDGCVESWDDFQKLMEWLK